MKVVRALMTREIWSDMLIHSGASLVYERDTTIVVMRRSYFNGCRSERSALCEIQELASE